MNKINFSILFVLILGFGNHARACSCIGEISVKKAVRQSDLVFLGKVINQEDFTVSVPLEGTGSEMTIAKRRYTFEVQTVFKGKAKTSQVQITTGVGNGDCGFSFSRDREYVVYADYAEELFADGEKVAPYLHTNVCKRTTGKIEEEARLIRKRCWGKAGK